VRSLGRVDRAGRLSVLGESVVEQDPDRCVVDESGVRGAARPVLR
jgi:hypothetical protein